MKKSILSNSF